MSGACFFSKLNASSGYWQTKVNEEISNVLALGTSLGRYRFKRLPYRIHSTCNVFQWEITSIISDVCGSANSLYGIIVWGRTLAEHNECLNKTFLKICKSGPKLNNKKMSNWGKNHCISQTYHIIWRCTSQPSKNWTNIENVISELCKWTSVIHRHGHILKKIPIELRRSNLC